jgi:hypothetical protein
MQSRATIMHAKVSGSDYGRESTLTLTLDVKLPTPVEVRSINEWAATELDWQSRQEIARAQERRRNGKPKKLTKAEKKAQAEAHEQGTECGVTGCESCYGATDDNLVCLIHQLPLDDCHECDLESAIFLDPEDVERLRGRYEQYAREQSATNREALQAAQEAALFLLLIKKPVQVSIAPAQQAFADLLQLSAGA